MTTRIAAQIAAHESWAHTPDRAARTAPARAAMLARFEDEVDPDRTLPPAERAARAEHARKAYFKRLALKSARARAAKRVEIAGVDVTEHVTSIVDAAPPLTPAQRDRIASLLRQSDHGISAPVAEKKKAPAESVMYRHFDEAGRLIYVGITVSFAGRASQHAASSWWSKWTTRIERDPRTFASRNECAQAERQAIKSEHPVFNKIHAEYDRDERICNYLIERGAWEHLEVGGVSGDSLAALVPALVASGARSAIAWHKEACA